MEWDGSSAVAIRERRARPRVRPSRFVARQREARAWELRVQGRTQKEIAGDLEREGLGRVSQAAVSKMLGRTEARLAREVTENIALCRVLQLERLEYLYRQAMRAWERSKEDGQSEQRKTLGEPGAGEPRLIQTVHTTWTRCGNPAFLGAARRALADIRKLLGLNGLPVEAFKDGTDDEDEPFPEQDVLEDDELKVFETPLAKLAGLPPPYEIRYTIIEASPAGEEAR
jgi:hypothetical protein